ncbi:hypothetical protein JTB14_028009 [Gonioctena quinquepunctata]|nr:hypothetical protein JTB14_028009 [Gonioctena quinquepunctata]
MSSTTVSMDFVKSRLLDEELKIEAKFESNGAILKCHSQQARIHVTSVVNEAIRLQIVARVQPEEISEDAEDIIEVFTEAIEVKAQLKITIKVNQVYKQTRVTKQRH